MGEGVEEKKSGEKKMEEKKLGEKEKANEPEKAAEQEKEEKKYEETKEAKESKEEDSATPPPPPPQEIVLKVYMHCEGCARKVRSSLKGFEGVEDVITDCKTQKVIVKGEKADPLKVLERVQRKSHRRVELLSPIPKPPAEEEKKTEGAPKPEEKKEEAPVILVVIKVHMHCEACAHELKKRIMRIKGVESAEPDLKNSEVSVKGLFEPSNLVKYLYKRTGKHAVIVKQETEKIDKAEESIESKEDKKVEDVDDEDKKDGSSGNVRCVAEEKGDKKEADRKEADGEVKPDSTANTVETKVKESKKNEFLCHYPDYSVRFVDATYNLYPQPPPPPLPLRYLYPGYDPPMPHPPQMFSDENPNACSVM